LFRQFLMPKANELLHLRQG